MFKRKHSFLKRRTEHNLTFVIFRFKQAYFFRICCMIYWSIRRLEISRKFILWLYIYWSAESLWQEIGNLKHEQIHVGNVTCSVEWTRWFPDKSVVFVKMGVRIRSRMNTAALWIFETKMRGEPDANKTPTHRQLPRKHARRGIVNIWTSKRGKSRLIDGC